MKKQAKQDKGPKGIGGWLILPTIGLILSALVFAYGTLSFLVYISEEGAYFMFLLYGSIAFLSIYSLILLFRKKKAFPTVAIITLWAGVGFVLIMSWLFPEEGYGDIFPTLIGVIIWTWYFRVSKRVKNTFVK